MSMPYPQEFGDDVVRVVLARPPGVWLRQIAKDFGGRKVRAPPLDRASRNQPGQFPCQFPGEFSWRERVECRGCGVEAPQSAVGAGERGPVSGGGVSIAGQSPPKMMYPLVGELAINAIPVAVMGRVLGLPDNGITGG
jgi:hypothetical protein